MGNQIYFKIAGWVDLDVLIIFTPCQSFDITNGFWVLPKTCNFTICSIFSNSGHVGWCTVSPDTILKLDTIVMIQNKFGFHWSSTFRGEDFWKSLRRTMDDDNGRQVMTIAHMTLRVRWAKNVMARTRKYYLKNNYLTLRSKVKITWRSLWYATHSLMVMHPHTKYNWPIWKDKKVMVRTTFTEREEAEEAEAEEK